MTFAAITPALIVGAFAERMKFSAVALFIPLWVTFVYFPIAHMVWYWAGPDAIDAAAKALAAAADDAAKTAAQAKLDEVMADAGQIFPWGALDFAGGTVVHINAGIAGLVGALMIGKRIGYGKELMPPHSLTMTMIGASLLWVGWFGFNAGSNLEANGGAALAMINTFVATAAAALSWMFAEWMVKGKPSLLGVAVGRVAGLVAVTPASGFAGPMGAIVLGLVAGVVCLFFCTDGEERARLRRRARRVRRPLHRRHHRRLGTGILVNPALGGTGIIDYTTGKIADYDMATQMIAQFKAVLTTLVWSGVGSLDPLQDRRHHRRPARPGRSGARRPRHHRPRRTRLHHVSTSGWGGDPAPPLPSEAPVARPGPLLFGLALCALRRPTNAPQSADG